MAAAPLRPGPFLQVAAGGPPCASAVRGGLTEREIQVLLELRRVHDALRTSPPASRQTLEKRLSRLREEREEARRERMVLLGHAG